MKNINYSPQLRFNVFRPNYSYNNLMNMTPQINVLHQNQGLSGMKIPNTNNNTAFNRYISYTPYLTKNYSTSFMNNNRLSLNQVYRPTTPLCNNNLNINTIYQNKNNQLFSVINNDLSQNAYSPQTSHNISANNSNDQILYFQLNSQNQNYEHNQSMSRNMNEQFIGRYLFQNINYNTNNITNININNMIQNQNNIYNDKNIQYFVNNNKTDKITKIEKLEPLKKNTLTGIIINNQNQQSCKNIRKIDTVYHLVSPIKNINTTTKRTDNEEPKENFDPSEFTIIKRIGEGTYGKIYLTQWKRNNRKYAMKKVIIKGNETIKKNKEKTQIVMNFIKKTKSKGVIKIFGDLVKRKGGECYYYVLMEIADKDWEKELFERQRYKQFYTEKELFIIMNQLIKTLSLMQKNHITHRDIKPQNILITKGIYKISDFGEARTLIREGVIVSRVRGTELYMSPILFQGLRLKLVQVSHNTFKSDVFSFGMCIFFASTLTFNSLCDIRELNDMKLIKEKLIHYLNGRYSFKFITILYEMLQIEEHNRPDFITLEQKYFS